MNEPLELTTVADVSVLNAGPEFGTDKRTAAVSSQNIASLAKTNAIKPEATLYNPVGPMQGQPADVQIPGVSTDMVNQVNAFMNGGAPEPVATAAPTTQVMEPTPAPTAPFGPTNVAYPAPEQTAMPMPSVAEQTPVPTAPFGPTNVAYSEPESTAMPISQTPEPTLAPRAPFGPPNVAFQPPAPNTISKIETSMELNTSPATEAEEPTNPMTQSYSPAATSYNGDDLGAFIEDIRDMLSSLHDNLDELDDKFAALEKRVMEKSAVAEKTSDIPTIDASRMM